MQWSDAVGELIDALPSIEEGVPLFRRLTQLVDLTNLNESATEREVMAFLQKARTPYGDVAGVCVYPAYLSLVAAQFAGTPIKVCTVANFPDGSQSLETVLTAIGCALEDGAQEVDIVFPYARYLAGERHYAQTFVQACKAACGDHAMLKVILETGVLNDPAIIADASFDVLAAGADFIKTSTGKASEGATLEAAATMLLVIKHMSQQVKRPLGLKVSGGIRDVAQAAQYVALADQIMGRDWVQPMHFRLGTSQLIDRILSALN